MIVRFGAAVRFATGTGVDAAGFAAGVGLAGVVLAIPVGLGDAPGWGFCGVLTGGKIKLHKIRTVDESNKANRTRFWFIFD